MGDRNARGRDLRPVTGDAWLKDSVLVVRQSEAADAYEIFDRHHERVAVIATTLGDGRTFSESWQTKVSHGLRGWHATLCSMTGDKLAEARPAGLHQHYNLTTETATAELRAQHGDRPYRLLNPDGDLIASILACRHLARNTGHDAEITIGPAATAQPATLHLLIAALICIYTDARTPAAWPAAPPQ